MCFLKWTLRDETQEDSWERRDHLASLSRDLALTRLLVKVNIFHMWSLKVCGLGGAMELERVAGPGHRATRALWAKVFGPCLASRGEPKGGFWQALLATW